MNENHCNKKNKTSIDKLILMFRGKTITHRKEHSKGKISEYIHWRAI